MRVFRNARFEVLSRLNASSTLLLLTLTLACESNTKPQTRSSLSASEKAIYNSEEFAYQNELNILVFGDSGTSQTGQHAVSRAMHEHCYPNRSNRVSTPERLERCDFAIVLGDIIYETGVSSASDPLFDDAFKSVYDHFFPMVFWTVLGNHDWGNPTHDGSPFGIGRFVRERTTEHHYGRLPNNYVEFASKSPEQGGSKVWTQPALNYQFSYNLSDLGLDVAAIDTMTLLVSPLQRRNLRQTLNEFLEKDRDENFPRWRILIGHNPLYSHSRHGNMPDNLRQKLLDSSSNSTGQGKADHLNLCGKVHLYLGGHDHNQQFIESNECPEGESLYQVVSGAAAKSETPDSEEISQVESSVSKLLYSRSFDLGFTHLRVSREAIVIEYYSVDTSAPMQKARLNQVCTIRVGKEALCEAPQAVQDLKPIH